MQRTLIAIAALLLLGASPGLAQPVPGALPPASSGPAGARPETDLKLDSSRRPADLLAFAQIRTGAVVMDVWPGRGYWTRLFSTAVGPTGKVYAYVPTEIAAFKPDPVVTIKAVAAEPGRDNVVVVSDPAAEQPPPAFQNILDVVFTFENYHDLHDSFMKGLDVNAFNRAVFLLLKPGGAYVIVDHAALAGTGLKNTEDLHRIDPAALRAEVEKAGFKFDGESTVLANPDDPKTKVVFDTSIRGKTDRFAYRFVKPKP
jgi:predicted methyltransferase